MSTDSRTNDQKIRSDVVDNLREIWRKIGIGGYNGEGVGDWCVDVMNIKLQKFTDEYVHHVLECMAQGYEYHVNVYGLIKYVREALNNDAVKENLSLYVHLVGGGVISSIYKLKVMASTSDKDFVIFERTVEVSVQFPKMVVCMVED